MYWEPEVLGIEPRTQIIVEDQIKFSRSGRQGSVTHFLAFAFSGPGEEEQEFLQLYLWPSPSRLCWSNLAGMEGHNTPFTLQG